MNLISSVFCVLSMSCENLLCYYIHISVQSCMVLLTNLLAQQSYSAINAFQLASLDKEFVVRHVLEMRKIECHCFHVNSYICCNCIPVY